MKKFFALILAMSMALSMIGCSENGGSDKTTASQTTPAATEAAETTENQTTPAATDPVETTEVQTTPAATESVETTKQPETQLETQPETPQETPAETPEETLEIDPFVPEIPDDTVPVYEMGRINVYDVSTGQLEIVLALYSNDSTELLAIDGQPISAAAYDLQKVIRTAPSHGELAISGADYSGKEFQICWYEEQKPLNVFFGKTNTFGYLVFSGNYFNVYGNYGTSVNMDMGGAVVAMKNRYDNADYQDPANNKPFPHISLDSGLKFSSPEYYVQIRVPYGKFNEVDKLLSANNHFTMGGEENPDFNWLMAARGNGQSPKEAFDLISTIGW